MQYFANNLPVEFALKLKHKYPNDELLVIAGHI